LGHPSYYPRFGFRPASTWKITSPFPAPEEAFMALELLPDSLKGINGMVVFPDEFDGL
jgi:putative acetyltransferase